MPSLFSVSSESKEFNIQPLLRKREREIARWGYTTTEIPSKYIGNSEELKPELLPVKELIEKEIKAQAELLHGLSIRIYHNTQLAHIKSRTEEFAFLACITMRRVKAIQQEYIEELYIMKALEAFQTHLRYGLVKAKTATRDIATIKGVHENKNRKQANKRRTLSFADDTLLKQLRKKEFFPILKTNHNGRATISYTDLPPFCNHTVALERTKEIAAQGFSMLKLPSGYSKIMNPPSPETIAALALTDMARKDQEGALQRHVVKLQVAIDIAERYFISGHERLAAKGMRKVKTVQQEYIHILRRLEAFNAYEHSLQYGFINLDAVEDDLKEIVSVPPSLPTKAEEEESDDDLVTQLMDQKFFPMIFPILGGGVKIHYTENPPKPESVSLSKIVSNASSASTQSSDSDFSLPDRRISIPPVPVQTTKTEIVFSPKGNTMALPTNARRLSGLGRS